MPRPLGHYWSILSLGFRTNQAIILVQEMAAVAELWWSEKTAFNRRLIIVSTIANLMCLGAVSVTMSGKYKRLVWKMLLLCFKFKHTSTLSICILYLKVTIGLFFLVWKCLRSVSNLEKCSCFSDLNQDQNYLKNFVSICLCRN